MKGATVTEQDYEYITTTFAGSERELLEKMKRRADQRGLPEIMISAEQARFLSMLVKMNRVKRCLDVGTLFGFSAAIMARSMPENGRVVSVEKNEDHHDVARQNLEELDLLSKVRLIHGRAIEVLPDLRDQAPFDLILIDADKRNYSNYFHQSLKLVQNDSIIVADNTLYKGKAASVDLDTSDPDHDNAAAIRKYNELTSEHESVESTIVPAGDGLNIALCTDV